MSFCLIAHQHIKTSFSIVTEGGKSGFPSCRAAPTPRHKQTAMKEKRADRGHREAKSVQRGGDERFTGNFLISGRWETCDRSETVSAGPLQKDVLAVFM